MPGAFGGTQVGLVGSERLHELETAAASVLLVLVLVLVLAIAIGKIGTSWTRSSSVTRAFEDAWYRTRAPNVLSAIDRPFRDAPAVGSGRRIACANSDVAKSSPRCQDWHIAVDQARCTRASTSFRALQRRRAFAAGRRPHAVHLRGTLEEFAAAASAGVISTTPGATS